MHIRSFQRLRKLSWKIIRGTFSHELSDTSQEGRGWGGGGEGVGGGGSYSGAGCGDGSKSQLPWLAWESHGEQLSSRGVTRLRLTGKYHFVSAIRNYRCFKPYVAPPLMLENNDLLSVTFF